MNDYTLVTDNLLGVFDSVGGCDQGRLVSYLAGKMIAAHWQVLAEAEQKALPEHLASVLQTV